jgi:hypothetical protein
LVGSMEIESRGSKKDIGLQRGLWHDPARYLHSIIQG